MPCLVVGVIISQNVPCTNSIEVSVRTLVEALEDLTQIIMHLHFNQDFFFQRKT